MDLVNFIPSVNRNMLFTDFMLDLIILRSLILCIYAILPTDAACCPDINIEDVVLSNKIGEIAENTEFLV